MGEYAAGQRKTNAPAGAGAVDPEDFDGEVYCGFERPAVADKLS
jgi:hypothetical protein